MHEEHHLAENRFHFGPFFFWTGLQCALALGAIYLISPSTFMGEISQPGMLVLWTVLLGAPISLFEYLYHRYLLHSAVLPFLGLMHRAHSEHHSLTNVKAPVTPREPEKMVEVASAYPIVHEHQEESMQFPLFAISIFYLIFLLVLGLPLKLIFPGQPVLIATVLTSTLAYTMYEFWHAILHLPYDRYWQPLMRRGRVGRWIEHVYSFHLMHHWRPTINQAVVGLWGWAVWDHLFRTHHRPTNVPHDKSHVNYYDAAIPKPRWPIAMVDRWQPALYKFSRKVERMFGFGKGQAH